MFSVFVAPDIEDEKIDLIRAAAGYRSHANIRISKSKTYATRVEQLARRVAALVSAVRSPESLGPLSTHVLFDGMNLRGNREDYYDPRNSFLNDVLDRGLGIPITLSILYMEVARGWAFHSPGSECPDTSC